MTLSWPYIDGVQKYERRLKRSRVLRNGDFPLKSQLFISMPDGFAIAII